MALLRYLNRLINIRPTEWRRVSLAWVLAFFYRAGFVVGWTVLVAMFVSHFGIASLPYLFVLHAIFSVLGSAMYSVLIEYGSRRFLMVVSLILASVLLAAAFYLSRFNIIWFFALVIVAEAVLLMQFRILLTGFFEELFTPLESERTFPVIESAETIGGIFGGLAIIGFSQNFEMVDFALLWIAMMVFIIPIVMLSGRVLDDLEFFEPKEDTESKRVGVFSRLKHEVKKARQFGFLRNLVLIVSLHWILYNMLEFQYTKAVYNNVSGVILDTGSGLEHMLVHDLGVLFMIFSASSLLLQLLVAGRLIGSLGVVGSMLLHPLITILSLLGFTGFYNFFTAVLTKNNFTMSTVLYNNTYHISYYAVAKRLRGHTREFLEGVVRPVGALLGTSALIVLQMIFRDSALIFSINVLMLVVALALLVVVYFQQSAYTHAAVDELVDSKDYDVRSNAVSILAQRGHDDAGIAAMEKVVLNSNEPVSLRAKILRAFGDLRNLSSIPIILKTFEDSSSLLREAAIDALLSYTEIDDFAKKNLFLGYDVLEALKDLYAKETDRHVRLKIIVIISRMSSVAALEHLLRLLKSAKGEFKADIIYALSKFDDEAVMSYVYPYLDATNLHQRISAAIVLSRYEDSSDIALYKISEFVHSSSPKRLELACYALGELRAMDKVPFLLKSLNSKFAKVRLAAAIAMAKMGFAESVDPLVESMFDADERLLKEINHRLQNVDVRIKRNVDRMVKHLVSTEIMDLMEVNRGKSLSDLSSADLEKLRKLYRLVGEYNEVDRINCITK